MKVPKQNILLMDKKLASYDSCFLSFGCLSESKWPISVGFPLWSVGFLLFFLVVFVEFVEFYV